MTTAPKPQPAARIYDPGAGSVAYTAIMLIATAWSAAFFFHFHGDYALERYPFKFPDSWSWLVDALHWTGADVDAPVRPPVAPAAFGALIAQGQGDLIPFWGLAFHHLLALAVFALTKVAVRDPRTALLAGLLCLTNGSLLGNALYIGADVSANALLVLTLLFFAMGVRGRAMWFVPMGLCWAASALTQYAAAALVAPIVLCVLLFHRASLRRANFWLGLLIAAAFVGGYGFYKYRAYGDALYSSVQHGDLVRRPSWNLAAEHTRATIKYGWGTIAFVTWPVMLAAMIGIWESLARRTGGRTGWLLALTGGGIAAFFTFFYGFESRTLANGETVVTQYLDNRFIQYWAAPLMIFAAIGLRRLWFDISGHTRTPGDGRPILLRDSMQQAARRGPGPTAGDAVATAGDSRNALKTEKRREADADSPHGSGLRTALFALIVAAVVVINSIAKTQPFTDESPLVPGLALNLRWDVHTDPPETVMHVSPHRHRRVYEPFYYAHAWALRHHRDEGRALPCTSNDVVPDLQTLAAAISDAVTPDATLAMQSVDRGEYYWHHNALSFLTRRRVVAWGGIDNKNNAPRPSMVVSTDIEPTDVESLRFVQRSGRFSLWRMADDRLNRTTSD